MIWKARSPYCQSYCWKVWSRTDDAGKLVEEYIDYNRGVYLYLSTAPYQLSRESSSIAYRQALRTAECLRPVNSNSLNCFLISISVDFSLHSPLVVQSKSGGRYISTKGSGLEIRWYSSLYLICTNGPKHPLVGAMMQHLRGILSVAIPYVILTIWCFE